MAQRLSALSRQLSADAAPAPAPEPLAASTAAQATRELANERRRASFPARAMTLFLDGGEERTAFRERAQQLLAQHPELAGQGLGRYDLTLPQRRELTFNRVRRLYQIFLEHGAGMEQRDAIAELAGVFDLTLWVRNGVHFGLFLGALMAQGDQEQQDEWLPPAMLLQLYGSYAMTELGHGSFTRGFETTATFDRQADEFVIHTPTDTATKWWIGAAGQTATHTVCFARLLIDGQDKGVQTFVVQLRDLETHEPLPGVHIGDLGKKMGLQGVDNGWIQFDHVRVPRAHMLRRFASVSRDGVFTQTHKAQMAYAALIGTRGKLVTLSVGILKRALTIAVRYCGVRRQGEQVNPADPHPETKLLDYQSHQMRLMPAVAKAYAYHLQTSYIEQLIQKFDQQGGDISEQLLADIHGTMAGFKAFCTWDVQAAIEQCRQACGGNGYSSYTGLEELLANFSVIVTFEGDNTVMALQTANYLVRSVERQARGEALAGSVQYLDNCKSLKSWRVQSASDLDDPSQILDALNFYVGKQVLQTAAKFHGLESNKALPTHQARWNACQVELIEIARVHVFYNAASRFVELLRDGGVNPQLVPALSALCRLYVLQEFARGAGFFLRESFMTPAQVQLVHDELLAACARVRLDAVALVDSFNLSDHIIGSTIGAADGDVYTRMLKEVESRGGATPYFKTAIKPMLDGVGLDDE